MTRSLDRYVDRSAQLVAERGEPDWLSQVPEGRDLSRGELTRIAEAVGRDRGTWLRLVRRDRTRRYYAQLHRDPHLDVWLLCWTDDQDTGLHDHDVSAGAVHVCEGELVEERLEFRDGAFSRVAVEHGEGSTFDFDASHVHCIRHPGGPRLAASIHVYSPALCRMGYYEIDADSVLRRVSVSYAEELAAV
jgi:cysteine dioxygenase type I